MKDLKFRDLRADEIECRVSRATEKGVALLLYKNARCDMNMLDETVGPANWQREHYECKGNLFCRIGIRCDDGWIWKSDCGSESNAEKEKGEASDSFKRAAINWGIGRELYTAPFIWVSPKDCNLKAKNAGGKTVYYCKDSFSVKSILIEDKKITYLRIYNEKKGKDCFVWAQKEEDKPKASTAGKPKEETEESVAFIDAVQVKHLVHLLKENNKEQRSVCEKYGVRSIKGLTVRQYEEVCNSIG